jgi:hypothetical protein
MSVYNIKFFKDGSLIFETVVNHDIVYKALLYAEGELLNKKSGAEYDEVKITENRKLKLDENEGIK